MANVPHPTPMMAGGDEGRLGHLRAGRELYINKCSGCHALLDVDRFGDRECRPRSTRCFRGRRSG